MPVFQNPTGHSYSRKKEELIALSKEYDFYIVEDDHISDLYYDEKPTLLKALDDADKVFTLKVFLNCFYRACAWLFCGSPSAILIKRP